jgi:single-stranded DNA-binding protein
MGKSINKVILVGRLGRDPRNEVHRQWNAVLPILNGHR